MEEDLLKMIRIRPIEAADDPHMARLVRESLRRHGLDIPGTAYFDPELDHLSVHYALRPDRRAYFIAEGPAGRVLGGAGIGELGGYPDCAELQKIYVAPGAQRRGLGRALMARALGRALMARAESRAKELGYRRLYLETHSALAAAIRMYEALGYRRLAHSLSSLHGAMDHFYIKEL